VILQKKPIASASHSHDHWVHIIIIILLSGLKSLRPVDLLWAPTDALSYCLRVHLSAQVSLKSWGFGWILLRAYNLSYKVYGILMLLVQPLPVRRYRNGTFCSAIRPTVYSGRWVGVSASNSQNWIGRRFRCSSCLGVFKTHALKTEIVATQSHVNCSSAH